MPFEAQERDLWPIFAECGTILELVVLRNPQGRSRGCAFVTFESRQMAEKAIRQVDGKVRHGVLGGRGARSGTEGHGGHGGAQRGTVWGSRSWCAAGCGGAQAYRMGHEHMGGVWLRLPSLFLA